LSELERYVESSRVTVAEALRGLLEQVRRYARPVLDAVAEQAAQRTDRFHDPWQHAEAVAELCAQLLPDHLLHDSQDQIHVAEAAVLQAAAWLHEVGLAEPGTDEAYNVDSARYVWDPVKGRSRVPGLDCELAPAVAALCLAHRDHPKQGGEVEQTLRKVEEFHYWRGTRLRLAALAAVLRLAYRLEVYHRRSAADLGPEPPPPVVQAWVKAPGPVGKVDVEAGRARVTVRLAAHAQTSETHRTAVRLWCQAINEEFENEIQWKLVGIALAYKPPLVNFPEDQPATDGEADACDRFRDDARAVLDARAELGPWALCTAGDGFPILQRPLIDRKGRPVVIQIVPTTDYPHKPPLVKSDPRVEDASFSAFGQYDQGSSILHWEKRAGRSSRLPELCEELRYFEDPAHTFAAEARQAAERRPRWQFTAGQNPELVARVQVGGTSCKVSLHPHISYPLAPPRLEGVKELEQRSGKRFHPAEPPAQLWDRLLRSEVADPLGEFLGLLEDWFTTLGGASWRATAKG
jgi:hypothetical protein